MVFKGSRTPPGDAPVRPPQPGGIAVRVFMADYVLGGYVARPGQAFLGWLNNVNQRAIVLTQVQAMGLAPDNVVPAFSVAEVTLPKNRIVAVDLMDDAGRRTIQLAPRRVPAAIYAGDFIIRADLHPPGEMAVANLFSVMSADFFSVSEARIHSAVPGRDFGPVESQILLINQRWVDFYHAL